jgi:hypothetical protein
MNARTGLGTAAAGLLALAGLLAPAGCGLLPALISGELALFGDDDGPDDIDEAGDIDVNDEEDDDGAEVPDTVPDFSSAKFSNPTKIDNPYFPLTPGARLTYRAVGGGADEEIIVEVLDETRDVAGVECRVVRDRVFVDGLLIEDTFDWYAQDDAGNVWYMGEDVTDYSYDESGALIGAGNPGAWETGKDVAGVGAIARPGYIMPAAPRAGARYHQEYYPGEAEDYGEVVGVDVPVTLGDSTSYTTVKTRDQSSLDPTIDSFKYYAPGVGVVLEEGPDGERVELTSVE